MMKAPPPPYRTATGAAVLAVVLAAGLMSPARADGLPPPLLAPPGPASPAASPVASPAADPLCEPARWGSPPAPVPAPAGGGRSTGKD